MKRQKQFPKSGNNIRLIGKYKKVSLILRLTNSVPKNDIFSRILYVNPDSIGVFVFIVSFCHNSLNGTDIEKLRV